LGKGRDFRTQGEQPIQLEFEDLALKEGHSRERKQIFRKGVAARGKYCEGEFERHFEEGGESANFRDFPFGLGTREKALKREEMRSFRGGKGGERD